jgi:hypothetical protein
MVYFFGTPIRTLKCKVTESSVTLRIHNLFFLSNSLLGIKLDGQKMVLAIKHLKFDHKQKTTRIYDLVVFFFKSYLTNAPYSLST